MGDIPENIPVNAIKRKFWILKFGNDKDTLPAKKNTNKSPFAYTREAMSQANNLRNTAQELAFWQS